MLNFAIQNHDMKAALAKLKQRLLQQYKLVLINSKSLETAYQRQIQLLYVYSILFVALLLILTPMFYLFYQTASTSTKKIVNPTTEKQYKQHIIKLNKTVNDLEDKLQSNNQYIQSIRTILTKNQTIKLDTTLKPKTAGAEVSETDLLPSGEDSLFRDKIIRQEYFNQNNNIASNTKKTQQASDIELLFTPLKGLVTQNYSIVDGHLAVDIAAKEGESIKAAEEGTVIFANFTADTGYVMIILHNNGMITAYKHNSIVYKKAGDFVEKGEVIAAVGNTGELTTGPHLHFEVWVEGKQVDPKTYVDL